MPASVLEDRRIARARMYREAAAPHWPGVMAGAGVALIGTVYLALMRDPYHGYWNDIFPIGPQLVGAGAVAAWACLQRQLWRRALAGGVAATVMLAWGTLGLFSIGLPILLCGAVVALGAVGAALRLSAALGVVAAVAVGAGAWLYVSAWLTS